MRYIQKNPWDEEPKEQVKAKEPPKEVPKEASRVIPKEKADGRFRSATKERVSIWIDNDVLARLRSGGPGWQTKVKNILRRHVLDQPPSN